MRENIIGLQHIGIPTADVEKTLQFYQQLGFSVVYQRNTEQEKVWFLELAGVVLEVYPRDTAAGRAGAVDHIALNSRDVEEDYRQALRQGMTILDGGLHVNDFWSKGTKYFTILGPNGEKIEYSQYLG